MKHLAALAFAFLCPAFALGQYNSYTAFAPGTAPSYEGLWWNPSESGWGVSIAHQGDVLFAVWYTFDHDGQPTWFFMPEARLVGDDMDGMNAMMDMSMMGMVRNTPMYTGLLYRSSLSAGKVSVAEVGMATFLFKGRTVGVFAYTVGNVSRSRDITRMSFAGTTECTIGGTKAAGRENYQDLWWQVLDYGWGVNIAHQGDTLFATYYTYDEGGRATWLAMSNTNRYDAGTAYTGFRGPVLRATGPAFDSAWDAAKVSVSEIGTASFLFDARGAAEFAWRRDDVMQARKIIERMAFAAPASVCH